MEKLVWRKDFCIGHTLTDQQHEELFSIVNRLQSDLDEKALQVELMNLYKHTREHFAEEEAIMRNAHYLYYKEHREEHDRMLEELNSCVKKVIQDPGQMSLIRQFLSDWVKFHVLEQDKELSGYLET